MWTSVLDCPQKKVCTKWRFGVGNNLCVVPLKTNKFALFTRNDTQVIPYKIFRKFISITFSADTYTEDYYDYIYIYDGNDNLIGEYTGGALASKTITVQGDTVKIQLTSDGGINEYGFALVNVSVKYAYTPGDIDGTGVVDLNDVNNLARYFAGWDVDCNQAAFDVDGDGMVNLNDLIHLAQYVAGWDVEIF